MTLRLLGICGSLRAGSANRMLMREAVRLFGPAELTEGDLALPLYDGDLEAREGLPQPVERLVEALEAADAVVLSCPEYNQGLSGVMKNALDWISRAKGNPWRDKPVALMSAAAGRAGGARAQFSLRLCLVPFRPWVIPGPEVLVAGAAKEFDADGRLTNERYRALLEELMADLRRTAESRRPPAAVGRAAG